MLENSTVGHSAGRTTPVVQRYALAVLFVALALGGTLALQFVEGGRPTLFLFFAAVVASAWFGGRGAGWASVAISTLAVDYFFIRPADALNPSWHDLTWLVAFAVCAIVSNALASQRRRAEDALSNARDTLEAKVQERTAELWKTNEALQAEINERQRAEAALRASEERWRRAFEFSSIGMAAIGSDRRFIATNPAFQRMVGYSEEELRTLTPSDITHEGDRAVTEAHIADVECGRRPAYVMEKRYRRKDGSVIWVNLSVSYVPATDSTPAFCPGIVVDITERKRAEEGLQRQKAHLDELFELSPVAVALIDASDRIIRVNRQFTRVFGYAPEEAKDRSIDDLIVPDEVQADAKQYGRLMHAGQRIDTETVRRRKDGSRLHVSLVGASILDAAGKIGAYCIYGDITERKRVEEALRASEQRWRAVYENSAVGIALAQPSGRFVSANAAFQEMLGYTEAELLELSFLEITHEDDRQLNQALVNEVAEGRRKRFELEKRYWRKDGTLIWARINASHIFGTDPGPGFSMAIVEDITERKRAEEALQAAQAELARVAQLTTMGELAASIAHEINQPLAAIVTNGGACLRWLANDAPNLAEARQAVERIVKDGKRASEVIGGIRSLMKKAGPEMARLDINDVVSEVLALTRGELQRQGILVQSELSAEVPRVLGDRGQLQQVVLNLIMNAIEAMATVTDRPRLMCVRSQTGESGGAQIAVEDSGVGLDPRVKDRMFDTFFTTKPNGMGLGLSICRSIVEVHGGRLWAHSGRPHGAVFHVALPSAADGVA